MANNRLHVQECRTCPIRGTCGGIGDEQGQLLSCQMTCGNKCRDNSQRQCVFACPNNLRFFLKDFAEVQALDYLPKTQIYPPAQLSLPCYIPQFHHGYRRQESLSIEGGFAAIAIADILEYAKDVTTPDGLRARFRLAKDVSLIATGIARDHLLESWWQDFSQATRLLRIAGVVAVTTPNFSIYEDAPRHQNMISIARIHHFAEKLTAAGFPTIPHLYAQNTADWRRWERFLAQQSQLSMIAVEFQTGLLLKRDGLQYISELAMLQANLGRSLHILAIGGAQYAEALGRAFARCTIIDSQPFMKTMHRRGLNVIPPLDYKWVKSTTREGCALDSLLVENLTKYTRRVNLRLLPGPNHRIVRTPGLQGTIPEQIR